MIDGTTWFAFCLVVASKKTVSRSCGDRRNRGGTYLKKAALITPPVVLNEKPTSDENNQSKGQLNEDMRIAREIGNVRRWPMAEQQNVR